MKNWEADRRQSEAAGEPTTAPTPPIATTVNERRYAAEADATSREDEARLAAEREATEAARMKAEDAAVAVCQADVDDGSLARAASCWNARLYELRELDAAQRDPRGVPGCLDEVNQNMREVERCVSAPERSDDDIVAKNTCLASYVPSDNTCGPLNLVKVRAEFEAKVDFTTIKARVESRAAPIVARREKAAAEESARQAMAQAAADQEKKRCLGTSVLQVVLALRMGGDVSAASLKGCKYDVVIATVSTTTRDGWTIVHWGSDMVAAFKSRKRRVDGSFLRTSAKATYVGLGRFDRTDGGSATVATFRLSE
ncbi:MAG: hypothetical protein H0T46_30145 [Deltaproteobacteria bacterium]|nr:hypothetical protein [Deltaproteobacteria bacterium]